MRNTAVFHLRTEIRQVSELLNLRSSEAEKLICQFGHVISPPGSIKQHAGPCQHIRYSRSRDVTQFLGTERLKRVERLLASKGRIPPLQIEAGYLLDGHHRLAAAERLGIQTLQVRVVRGVLAEQRGFHSRIMSAATATIRPRAHIQPEYQPA